MKKIMISCIAVFAIGLATIQFAQAQTIKDFRSMPTEQKAHLITDSIKTMLSLSTDQYNKVYEVILDGATKAAPVAKSDDSRMGKGQKLRSILAEEEVKIKLVLTPAQFTLYQTKKQNIIAYYRQHLQDEKLVFNVPG